VDIPQAVVEKVIPKQTPTLMNTSKQVSEAIPAKTPETPKVEPKVEPKLEAPKATSAEILKRASTKTEADPVAPKETSYREDLDKITDPTVKAIAEKAIKDFESGYNKKFQTLAEQRKQLESMQQEISTWTPQRLQKELANPAFVQAMQILQQQAPPQDWQGSAEEWSGMSESDKRQMQAMRQEQQSLQAQLAAMKQKEEDTEIKKLYPDYEPQVVEEAIEGLRTGQITASRADIWKVVNHDKNVEKGYQFGYEDGYKKALEKLNGNSILPNNGSVTNADEVPEDVRKGGFSSIAMWRLNRSKNGAKKP